VDLSATARQPRLMPVRFTCYHLLTEWDMSQQQRGLRTMAATSLLHQTPSASTSDHVFSGSC
jgi:hypothetical protein